AAGRRRQPGGARPGRRRLRATETLSRGTLAMSDAMKQAVSRTPKPRAPRVDRNEEGKRGTLPGFPKASFPTDLRRTVIIESVAPVVDGGRYPLKREVGDTLEVTADIFKEGHEVLVAFLKCRRADETAWRETRMRFVDNDRWAGVLRLDDNARHVYAIEALADPFRSWLADLAKRVEAGQDVATELAEGVALIRDAARRARAGDHRDALAAYARRIEQAPSQAEAVEIVRDVRLTHFIDAYLDRSAATRAGREVEVIADRERARFAAWYEFFPRSSGGEGRHGTFKDAEAQLDRAAAMGFDVVYLPPIHPIGRAHRKGRNNALAAQPGAP